MPSPSFRQPGPARHCPATDRAASPVSRLVGHPVTVTVPPARRPGLLSIRPPAVLPVVPPVRAAWPDVFPITDRATGQSCLAIRLHGQRTSHLSGGLWPAIRYNPLIAWLNLTQDDHKYVSVKEAGPYLRPDWAGPFFGSFARAGYERMT